MRRVAALALLGVAAAQAAAPVQPPRVGNPRLAELSGLALSRADPALLWGLNDSGNGAELFRLAPDGADLGTVEVRGARNADWEDLAAFTAPEGPALLIADTGDNLGFRNFVSLYAVLDPGRSGRTARLLWRLDLRWPEGARDCEAVSVDEARGEIVLVTKRDSPPQVYTVALPRAAPRPGFIAWAKRAGAVAGLPEPGAAIRLQSPVRALFLYKPTALDIARDGRSALLLTPGRGFRYRRRADEDWGAAFARPGTPVRLPAFDQIEAVALAPDGTSAWVGAEARPSQFARVPLQ